MRIEIPHAQPRREGNYKFYVNSAYGEPSGTIWLGEGHALTLSYVTAEDCDRLIRVAAEVKQKIIGYTAKMSAPHGRANVYQGTCQLCGKPEADELHAEPAPAPDPLVISDSTIAQAEYFARPGNTIDDERAVAGGTAVKYRLGCGCVIGLSAGWPAGTEAECIGHGKTAIEAAVSVTA